MHICTNEIVYMYLMCIPHSVTNHDFRPLIPFAESNRSPDVYFHVINLVGKGIVVALACFFLLDFLCFVFSYKIRSKHQSVVIDQRHLLEVIHTNTAPVNLS